MSIRLLLPIAFVGLTLSVAARAAILTSTSLSLAGSPGAASLSVEDLCAREVVIQPDPARHGDVGVSLSADTQAELSAVQLHASAGHAPAQIVGTYCSDGHEHRHVTLRVTLTVPAGIKLRVAEHTIGDYRIGAIGGPFDLVLAGANTVDAASVGSARIDLTGVGDVKIDHMNGDLNAKLSGDGNLGVRSGTIGAAHLKLSGVGNAAIAAPVREAWIAISGVGGIAFASPVQAVRARSVTGVGQITFAPELPNTP